MDLHIFFQATQGIFCSCWHCPTKSCTSCLQVHHKAHLVGGNSSWEEIDQYGVICYINHILCLCSVFVVIDILLLFNQFWASLFWLLLLNKNSSLCCLYLAFFFVFLFFAQVGYCFSFLVCVVIIIISSIKALILLLF